MLKSQTSNQAVAQNELIKLMNEVKISDSLLDYKIRNLACVVSENLELLHDEIQQKENQDVLLHRYNKITALFEIFIDLLPKSTDYFEKVNLLTFRLTQKSA